MLVISQKVGDIIKLGSDITVKVIDIKGGKVRLGIEAPKSVNIERVQNKQDPDNKDQSEK
ncbi:MULTISPECIES: carbon storage regulator [Succinivibrio]|uniref:Translational regulator CsrA n=1 Tax=Succinivibrio faecicola TaxID=2820300 RepID=A0ABS7DGW9_9GAMM|nr:MULTISPECIES: carbon storage regulator [Succinivibrio]MBW7570534.1 carbon storage regulator [Succinivibrio faecicola]MCI6938672.1 carbon storage regulator [Succinatimonas hippei]MDD6206622.1 carbon storage regulator [Succinivibrio sp.]